jgi:hypothetical protein
VASTLNANSGYGPAALVALVRDFDRDAASCRKRISEILQYEPESFYATTIEILKRDTDSRAAQFLVALMLSQNLIFRALCEPALSLERATTLARMAIRADPMADIALARQLADASTGTSDPNGVGMAERLMVILDKISDGKRILPSLMRMLRNNNPYLRSKAVLMIGRGGRSLNWIRMRLEESDTRVRANAVEALWGMDGPEARQLLESSTRDSNNRVAGNALLGLYWVGESSVLPELVKMASHDSPAFRRTAAWVMGETGDPRFSEILGRMLADTSSDVRKNSFTAVGQIRAAVTQVSQTTEWLVSGFAGPKDVRISERRVRLAVMTPDGSGCPKVLPAQFIMNENGQPIWSYKVIERPFPEAMSVIFLFPRSIDATGKAWDNGALRCLNWKRTTDLWCVLHYSAAENAPAGADLELPSFIANASQAAQAFQQTTNRTDCTGFWTGVLRAVQRGGGPVRGNRHLIVFAPADVGDMPDDGVITAALASRTSVQVVTTAPNAGLQEFAHRAGGYLHLVEEGTAIEDRISMVYLNLLARYEIRYQPVCPEATTLKVRVHTPSGWGETTVPLV